MSGALETAHPAGDSPGLALWRVTHAWQRRIRAALMSHELTHVQFVLLASLTWMDHEESVTQRELADHAGTDVMMTSQVVRALEAKGLITRHPHPSDRRAVALRPTSEGVALANRATADVEAADLEFFSAIDPDDRAGFSRCLDLLSHESRS